MANCLGTSRGVEIGDPHTPRIVDQHAYDVPLGNGLRNNENRMQERDQRDAERGDSQRYQDRTVPRSAPHAQASVRDQRRDTDRHDQRDDDISPEAGGEGEPTLLEHYRSVLEQELEQSFQRHSDEDALCRNSTVGGVPTVRPLLRLRESFWRRWLVLGDAVTSRSS